MRLKYYLRGAGVGVIVSTLILMIAFHVYSGRQTAAEPETEAPDLTIAEALSEREQEQTELETETELIVPPKETEPVTETEIESEAESEEEAAEEPEDSADTANAADTEEESAEEAEEEPEAPVPTGRTVTIQIYHGDSPSMVANRLAGAGIIEDADGFYRYLVQNGLNDSLEVGSFSIPEGADFPEIAKILTTNEYERRMQ